MKNRINQLFQDKKENILSVYFTAGYPKLDDTVSIIEKLVANGVDLIEIGMPFSDPVADGPVIQHSSLIALKNGMTIKTLFEQLKGIREKVNIPLILMGYLNPVIQFGVEKFCEKCSEVGIDGLILPDLPLNEYQENYREVFAKYNLHNILLITPQTSEKRLVEIDEASSGFIYMVSSSSTTGAKNSVADFHIDYFERIQNMKLKNPRVIGFGISNQETFYNACKYAQGAIIGSAFVKALEGETTLDEKISNFVNQVVKTV
ncbi:tryptophan synthase subunit alpha [Mangrovibacterium diazotrophicum]|uniref:Tryptophan synthase alpha chain n=1 Tax=Mangrovibacterium diazotrophicum TaxID=1261403 RepID=A0A419W8Z3_9BACT|nr:tryptophan synthase subunit alpha [Mangrovibacterium diazotrophicum]RKD91948.1 tryptophan synthase alpha chain [Mangrovibacterium diazotrophicum]